MAGCLFFKLIGFPDEFSIQCSSYFIPLSVFLLKINLCVLLIFCWSLPLSSPSCRFHQNIYSRQSVVLNVSRLVRAFPISSTTTSDSIRTECRNKMRNKCVILRSDLWLENTPCGSCRVSVGFHFQNVSLFLRSSIQFIRNSGTRRWIKISISKEKFL